MSAITTADLHQTDNPRDAHRWGLFKWLRKEAESKGCSEVILLGDLTDAKDRHSAKLTNQLNDEVEDLAGSVDVWILLGNHDYIDPNNPFFRFLGSHPHVHFVTKPSDVKISLGRCLFLPSTRNWEKDWEPWYRKFDDYEYIFTHQTYDGAKTENGTELRGVPPSIFKGIHGKVLSGDIHVPQQISKVISYVGAPYRVRFGDDFTPRVLYIKDGHSTEDLRFPCRNKHLLEIRGSVDDLEKQARAQHVDQGDQVKIRVFLKRSEYADWAAIRDRLTDFATRKADWEVCGVEMVASEMKAKESVKDDQKTAERRPSDRVKDYVRSKKLPPEALETGLKILDQVEEKDSG